MEVSRVKGCSGAVSLRYRTIDGSAVAGTNYTETSGTLEWAHLDVEPKFVCVPILDDDVRPGKLYFEVEVGEASGGAIFDADTDGGSATTPHRSDCPLV